MTAARKGTETGLQSGSFATLAYTVEIGGGMRFLTGFVPVLGILAQTAQPIPPYVPVPPVRPEPIPTQIPQFPSIGRYPARPIALAFRSSPAADPVVKVEAKYTPEARAAGLQGIVSL